MHSAEVLKIWGAGPGAVATEADAYVNDLNLKSPAELGFAAGDEEGKAKLIRDTFELLGQKRAQWKNTQAKYDKDADISRAGFAVSATTGRVSLNPNADNYTLILDSAWEHTQKSHMLSQNHLDVTSSTEVLTDFVTRTGFVPTSVHETLTTTLRTTRNPAEALQAANALMDMDTASGTAMRQQDGVDEADINTAMELRDAVAGIADPEVQMNALNNYWVAHNTEVTNRSEIEAMKPSPTEYDAALEVLYETLSKSQDWPEELGPQFSGSVKANFGDAFIASNGNLESALRSAFSIAQAQHGIEIRDGTATFIMGSIFKGHVNGTGSEKDSHAVRATISDLAREHGLDPEDVHMEWVPQRDHWVMVNSRGEMIQSEDGNIVGMGNTELSDTGKAFLKEEKKDDADQRAIDEDNEYGEAVDEGSGEVSRAGGGRPSAQSQRERAAENAMMQGRGSDDPYTAGIMDRKIRIHRSPLYKELLKSDPEKAQAMMEEGLSKRHAALAAQGIHPSTVEQDDMSPTEKSEEMESIEAMGEEHIMPSDGPAKRVEQERADNEVEERTGPVIDEYEVSP